MKFSHSSYDSTRILDQDSDAYEYDNIISISIWKGKDLPSNKWVLIITLQIPTWEKYSVFMWNCWEDSLSIHSFRHSLVIVGWSQTMG